MRKFAANRKTATSPISKTLSFTVDAALFRELGERLVGQHHIALAELIKNAYDADAERVVIDLDNSRIVVEDDGNGMSFEEFRDFWMRIGTPHKQKRNLSRRYNRPLTGSKGIGRLAAQFLGSKIQIATTATGSNSRLIANVDWSEAIKAPELVQATARYREESSVARYAANSKSGTRIEITGLNDHWTEETVRLLAQQLWPLRPPFKITKKDDPKSFEIVLTSENDRLRAAFEERIGANLDIWSARIKGKLQRGEIGKRRILRCTLQFRDTQPTYFDFEYEKCLLDELEFDIRVFTLFGKQRFGIAVAPARDYLSQFGGVHVFDAGFHLPYYGSDTDWLGIEQDHSHRLSVSDLLPEKLQVKAGLTYLPTNSRIYGVVEIDTALERRTASSKDPHARNYLQIQVSRDRLVDNAAYSQLRDMVRVSLDYYATRQTLRVAESKFSKDPPEVSTLRARRIRDILTEARDSLPDAVYDSLISVISSKEEPGTPTTRSLSLLGPLATAGLNAIALEHETGKQLTILESLIEKFQNVDTGTSRKQLLATSKELSNWLSRARSIRAVFVPLLDEEDRDVRLRLPAREVIADVRRQVAVLTRGMDVDVEQLNSETRLPAGSVAEWSALFQNVLINASNAMLDVENRSVFVHSHAAGVRRAIVLEDSGSGIDLQESEKFFEPFVRANQISFQRRALGLGGTGLGLTIVRMLARNLQCEVRFIAPSVGYATAFELSWNEE